MPPMCIEAPLVYLECLRYLGRAAGGAPTHYYDNLIPACSERAHDLSADMCLYHVHVMLCEVGR